MRNNSSVAKGAITFPSFSTFTNSSRPKKKKHRPDLTALIRECELAESWVEASKQVVIELQNVKRRPQTTRTSDVMRLRDLKEDRAVWMYNIIFHRALSSRPPAARLNARGRIVKTIQTADGNATASDSERDEITDHLPPDLVRELRVTQGLKEMVVDELIQTWTLLDPKEIRHLTGPTRNTDKDEMEKSAKRFAQRYLNSEKFARVDDESPPPTSRRSKPRSENGEQGYTIGEDHTDSARGEEPQRMTAPEVPLEKTNSAPSRPPSPEIGTPQPPTYDQTISEQRAKQEAPLKNVKSNTVPKEGNRPYKTSLAPEPSSFPSKRSTSRSNKRASNQQNASKVTFEDGDPHLQQKDEGHPRSSGLAHEGSQRGRSRSDHDIGHATHPVAHFPSSRPTMYSDTDNPRGNGYVPGFGMGSHYAPSSSVYMSKGPTQLPSGSLPSSRAYPYPLPAPTQDGHFPDKRQGRGVSEERENPKLAEMLQRIDKMEKETKAKEKARKDEDEARKEEDRKRAEEEGQRHTQMVDDLKKQIRELQESGSRNEERWNEEKRAMERRLEERRLEERTIFEEQAYERTETTAEQDTKSRTEEKLWELIGNLQTDQRRKEEEWTTERRRKEEEWTAERRRKEEEWMEEKNSILEEANELLEGAAEEKQEAIEDLESEYEEKLKIEQENVRIEQKKVEHYVQYINSRYSTRKERPVTVPGSTRASEQQPNVFDYADGRDDSSYEYSYDDESTPEERPRRSQFTFYNPWADGSPPRRNPMSVAGRDSDEGSNVTIIFPPRAGRSESGPNQLGNYLSSSGFKPLFEERESRTRFEKIGSGGSTLRGTLFWQPPASTAEADLYKSLCNCGWRPTYVRTTGEYESRFSAKGKLIMLVSLRPDLVFWCATRSCAILQWCVDQ